jgi:hypothetical protein
MPCAVQKMHSSDECVPDMSWDCVSFGSGCINMFGLLSQPCIRHQGTHFSRIPASHRADLLSARTEFVWLVLRRRGLVFWFGPLSVKGSLETREGKSTMSNSLSRAQVPEGICSDY